MKRKIPIMLLATVALAMAFASSAKAVAQIGIYGYVDKVQYAYGEKGKLTIFIVNEGTDPLILQNITIRYPWNAIIPWEGNYTVKDIDEVISVDGNKTYTFDFTVPNDRGAFSSAYDYSEIGVNVVTDKTPGNEKIPISIANPPVNMAVQDMSTLVTLITVQILIAIIAAVIIAAAVFLSGRRPGVTWQKEE